ncbi:MAG: hypothetical protein PHT69_16060 [Bacteroidales bacterium]|nr:hypothetical protein [Bacteroidales bacterium]
MPSSTNTITVFEHQSLKKDVCYNDICFDDKKLKALQLLHGEKGLPYYKLIHNGVCFAEYVGVIQIGNTLIEVLPKADKSNNISEKDDKIYWRKMLIDMIRTVYGFQVYNTGTGALKIKPNSILDVYIEMFIREVEYLINKGFVKKYRKTVNNLYILKGSLLFGKNIQYNLTHQERFFVRHTTFDTQHLLHQIIYKTLKLLKSINTNAALSSNIGALLLNFPEMADIKVYENTFEKLTLNRKTILYQKAIEISRLLLLQYHPDLSKGRNHVLTLMFDMNLLWERFFYIALRKDKRLKVSAQNRQYFWKPLNGSRRSIRPDIKVQYNDSTYIIDTKWKMINKSPSIEDLRQMYAYHKYFSSEKVALVYPGDNDIIPGHFIDINNSQPQKPIECSLFFIDVEDNIKNWQASIGKSVMDWIEDGLT